MDNRVNIPMPDDLIERLKAEAEAEERSTSAMARLLIKEALESRRGGDDRRTRSRRAPASAA